MYRLNSSNNRFYHQTSDAQQQVAQMLAPTIALEAVRIIAPRSQLLAITAAATAAVPQYYVPVDTFDPNKPVYAHTILPSEN